MTAFVSDAGVTTPMVRVDQPFARLGSRVPLLRGSMNNWGEGDGFVKTGSTTWALTMPLAPGTYEFKVATADWAGVNLGSRLGATALTGDGELGLVPLGENLRLTVARAGTYRFTIDARDQRRASLSVKAIGS